MKGIKITLHRFNKKTSSVLKKLHHGSNWPVVYIINDKNEVYIGETTDVSIRANQHYAKEERRKLNKITIIDDEEANKSSILDLESFLIKYMSADGKFKLQNSNKGLQNHNYFRRNIYTNKFKEIWQELKLMGLVEKELKDIYNSNLFKFSPYKSLENDQYDVINTLIEDLTKDAKKNLRQAL